MGSFSRHEAEQDAGNYDSARSEAWPEADFPSGIEGYIRSRQDAKVDEANLRSMLLAKAVEYEIIPRLMMAHRFSHECSVDSAEAAAQVSPEDVIEFARQVMLEDDATLRHSISSLRERGIPIQSIFLDLLAPVARHLGELWEKDLCDFTEVTLGLGRLQQVLRDNSAALEHVPSGQEGTNGKRILLLPCPGEQHTFGLSLVAEFFQRAGWDVSTHFSVSEVAPAGLVRHNWYDVVGFSLGSGVNLQHLADCMKAVRLASQNPRVAIIAGGAIFALHPEYAAQIFADAIITDGSSAPELASRLVTSTTLQA
jgi:methanogenic corrinoid protein MtbC1